MFDCVHLLDYEFHKIHFKRAGSYIAFPDVFLKNKKTTINLINKYIKNDFDF